MRDFRLRGRAEVPCGSNSARNECSLRFVHGVGQAAVHILDDVGVNVENYGDVGVAQEFLYVPGMLACHEEYCSAGVAEIMEPKLLAAQVSLAINRTRRVRDVLVFPAPVDLVGEAQGAVKVGRAPVLGRAYDGRAAIAGARTREDLLEQLAREAPSSERHARREVVDEDLISSSPEYSLRSSRKLETLSAGRCLTVALTRPVSAWRW